MVNFHYFSWNLLTPHQQYLQVHNWHVQILDFFWCCLFLVSPFSLYPPFSWDPPIFWDPPVFLGSPLFLVLGVPLFPRYKLFGPFLRCQLILLVVLWFYHCVAVINRFWWRFRPYKDSTILAPKLQRDSVLVRIQH